MRWDTMGRLMLDFVRKEGEKEWCFWCGVGVGLPRAGLVGPGFWKWMLWLRL